jgi:hypothetical protein
MHTGGACARAAATDCHSALYLEVQAAAGAASCRTSAHLPWLQRTRPGAADTEDECCHLCSAVENMLPGKCQAAGRCWSGTRLQCVASVRGRFTHKAASCQLQCVASVKSRLTRDSRLVSAAPWQLLSAVAPCAAACKEQHPCCLVSRAGHVPHTRACTV